MVAVRIGAGDVVAYVDECDVHLTEAHRWSITRVGLTAYASTNIDGKTAYPHRLIANTPPGMDTDHIDGDGLNNVEA